MLRCHEILRSGLTSKYLLRTGTESWWNIPRGAKRLKQGARVNLDLDLDGEVDVFLGKFVSIACGSSVCVVTMWALSHSRSGSMKMVLGHGPVDRSL